MKNIYSLLYRYATSKDAVHPLLTTVQHKDGYLLASDGRIAVKIPAGYPSRFEGKAMDRQGKEISGRFPEINRVLPSHKHLLDPLELDFKELEQAIRNLSKIKMLKFGRKSYKPAIDLGVDGAFDLQYLRFVVELSKRLKTEFRVYPYKKHHSSSITPLYVSTEQPIRCLKPLGMNEYDYIRIIIYPSQLYFEFNEDKAAMYKEGLLYSIEGALEYKPEPSPVKKEWYE